MLTAVTEVPEIEAMIFDTDGVVTRTTAAHFGAWKRLFDDVLTELQPSDSSPFTDDDYRRDVDGKPRYDGVAAFLASRAITLPWGEPGDDADQITVCGLGNRKDAYFTAYIRAHGVEAFPTTVRFVEALRTEGIATAVISASRNCREVLRAADVEALFDVHVDGLDAERLQLAGKPDPAIFLEAARRLGVEPGRAGVVEDATAGVAAGRGGGFGLVLGIDRTGHPDALATYADIVVPDLGDVELGPDRRLVRRAVPDVRVDDLTSALDDGDLDRRLDGRRPVVFLDYDGTLTPIVARPELATLPPATKSTLEGLSRRCATAILSGRDLEDVRAMVPVDTVWFAGSHGFDLLSPDGRRHEYEGGSRALPELAIAETELREAVLDVPEAWVEHKKYAIAVHYRQTPDEDVPRLHSAVHTVAHRHDGLRMTGGKKIFELRPDIAWDKGRALRWILQQVAPDTSNVIAVYVGDDETDEDALREVRERGLGVVVGSGDRRTAAHHRLRDPAEVDRFLALLVEHCTRITDMDIAP
jgi:trehalose-phosphatase